MGWNIQDGAIVQEAATVPGGTPAANNCTLWIRTSDNHLIRTDDAGADHDLEDVFVQGMMIFTVPGTLETGTDLAMLLRASQALTIIKARATVKTAPTGATLIVDVNKGGTTIFTTQANRPTIAVSTRSADSGTPDVTTLADGDEVTIDIDQIGSTVAGADLTVMLIVQPA